MCWINTNKFSVPVYDEKYLKNKVTEFHGVIKANFFGNGVPKENMHYTCIACISINSVIKMEKKNYPQVYLEECKYKIREIQMSRFINTELDSDSESDAKLMIKLEPYSDSELKYYCLKMMSDYLFKWIIIDYYYLFTWVIIKKGILMIIYSHG